MRFVNTAKIWFAAVAVTVVAALPLCASIPRGYAGIGGQRSEIGGQRYEYDCAGRLTFASTGGAALAITYDVLGNRLTTCSGNATRIWVTDHADPLKRPLMETDANSTPVRWYIWGGGMLLAVVEADGTVRYAHSDEQGSVVALTDSEGNLTDQYCYGPYGTDWGHTGTNSIPFRWLGSHGVLAVSSFSSSLYLTRHRAYDAELGRFLSADPSGLGGGPNLYAYCLGNPLAYIDPLGLCAASGGAWYDGLRSSVLGEVAWSKDYINNSGMPWGLNGALNTGLDLVGGIASTPSAIGHLGEGTGTFVGNPSWETSVGMFQDVSTAAGMIAGGLSMYQSVATSSGAGTGMSSAINSYPPNRGFMPDEGNLSSVLQGTVVDRYGGSGGSFLSPQGTPAAARSLAPGAATRPLNTYEVVKPFEVNAGRAAPWFGQPGQGMQYDLGSRTVQDLINSGYLRPLQ